MPTKRHFLRRTLTAAAIASTAAMTLLAMPAQAQDKPINCLLYTSPSPRD